MVDVEIDSAHGIDFAKLALEQTGNGSQEAFFFLIDAVRLFEPADLDGVHIEEIIGSGGSGGQGAEVGGGRNVFVSLAFRRWLVGSDLEYLQEKGSVLGMKLLNRLERIFGRWAIANITVIIIAGQVMLYFMQRMGGKQGLLADPVNLWLLPGQILGGEVWRLVTFIFCPPLVSPIFVIFYWFLMYLFGTTLEQIWGVFRYNCFLVVGYLSMLVATTILWAWGGDMAVVTAQLQSMSLGHGLVNTSVFLYSTLFLGFARMNPDFTLNLYFLLPIRIKWLALIQWLAYGYVLVRGDWAVRLLVVASLANYLLFFGREHWRDYKRGRRHRSYQSKVATATKQLEHECRVCGLNQQMAPKTLFRYCSKCAGQCCYCPEHIQDHEHVTEEEAVAG